MRSFKCVSLVRVTSSICSSVVGRQQNERSWEIVRKVLSAASKVLKNRLLSTRRDGQTVLVGCVEEHGTATAFEEAMGNKAANGSSSTHRVLEGKLTHSTTALIRKLVAQASHARDIPPLQSRDKEASRDLLFAGEVDGVRCLLVKVENVAGEATTLSPREHEIARMIAKGYPNKTIAAVLEISVWTVSTHLRRIFAKLGVGSRAAMVARMMTSGKLGLMFPVFSQVIF